MRLSFCIYWFIYLHNPLFNVLDIALLHEHSRCIITKRSMQWLSATFVHSAISIETKSSLAALTSALCRMIKQDKAHKVSHQGDRTHYNRWCEDFSAQRMKVYQFAIHIRYYYNWIKWLSIWFAKSFVLHDNNIHRPGLKSPQNSKTVCTFLFLYSLMAELLEETSQCHDKYYYDL